MKRILILLLMVGSSLAYADRYVAPTNAGSAPDYETWAKAATNIQDAVNVAASETVWITNGIYFLTNQVNVQANITIKSVNGRAVTIVDGNNYAGKPVTNRCFNLTSGDVLDGFTVQNGWITGDSGSGIYCTGARVINCRIANNFSTNGGPGIYAISSSQITHCQITGNIATNSTGAAGIYANNSAIIGCEVSSNTRYSAAGYGGGVSFTGGSTISNCTIFANRNIALSGNTIGGGTFCQNYNLGQTDIICNSLIYGNSAVYGGGLFYDTWKATAKIQNCTIVSNYDLGACGGLYIQCYSDPTDPGIIVIENIIAYDNTGGTFSNFNGRTPGGGYDGKYSFINSCIAPTSSIVQTNLVIYTGIIESNPLFVDKNAGNWRLSKSSPCVNTGLNRDWMNGTGDLDGHSRIDRFSGIVDMGCYEFLHSGAIYGFR